MIALVLMSIAPLAAADGHWDEDRELTYAGTTRQDHPLSGDCTYIFDECMVVSSGIMHSSCHNEHGIAGTGIDSIGGGIFCDVRIGTTITITLHDEFLEVPEASVTCPNRYETPFHGPYGGTPLFGFVLHKGLGRATPSLTIEVPDDCINTGQEDGLTEIYFFFNLGDATTGTATLEYE